MESLNNPNIKNYRKIILFSSILLFIISLTQKCFCTSHGCADSIIVFVLGFFGIISGLVGLCWFANPLLILSWILIKNNKIAIILSIISFALSFSFLFFDEVMDDEAGHLRQIVSYKSGYWLWLLSNAMTLLGNSIIWFKLKKDSLKELSF